jgi:hypothetical protein
MVDRNSRRPSSFINAMLEFCLFAGTEEAGDVMRELVRKWFAGFARRLHEIPKGSCCHRADKTSRNLAASAVSRANVVCAEVYLMMAQDFDNPAG